LESPPGEPQNPATTPSSSDSRDLPTIVDALRSRVSQQPDAIAASFLPVDGSAIRWTRSELDSRTRRVAATLQQRGIRRALLLYPQGLDFVAAILGCFHAGTVAVPAPVPRPNRSTRRLASILQEASPDAILCDASVAAQRSKFAESIPASAALPWLETNLLDPQLADGWQPFRPAPTDIAFLQYTSGSTADPRGVMVAHGNLVANSHYIGKRFEHSAQSHFLSWLPHFHDMGLIGGILHPLHWGFPCTLLDPLDTMQKPVRWLRAIDVEGATTSGAPNFAYEACVRRVSPEERDALDLSRWDVAFNGAEPVSAHTIEHFTEFFAPSGFKPEAFFPCYGLAEATLFVTGGPKTSLPRFHNPVNAVAGRRSQERLVGCGRVGPDTEVAIVDPEKLERVAAGAIGEVWIAGPSIPVGYLREPPDASGSFGAKLKGSELSFFRTGDLGFVEDEELYITGRIKDIVIISGVNHAAEDLERSIEDAHPWLAPGRCAAFPIQEAGHERLGVAVEIAREHWQHIVDARGSSPRPLWKRLTGLDSQRSRPSETKENEIVEAIRASVSQEHGIHAGAIAILPPGALPRTSSGKVQRHACRADYESGRLSERKNEAVSNATQPGPHAGFSTRSH